MMAVVKAAYWAVIDAPADKCVDNSANWTSVKRNKSAAFEAIKSRCLSNINALFARMGNALTILLVLFADCICVNNLKKYLNHFYKKEEMANIFIIINTLDHYMFSAVWFYCFVESGWMASLRNAFSVNLWNCNALIYGKMKKQATISSFFCAR